MIKNVVLDLLGWFSRSLWQRANCAIIVNNQDRARAVGSVAARRVGSALLRWPRATSGRWSRNISESFLHTQLTNSTGTFDGLCTTETQKTTNKPKLPFLSPLGMRSTTFTRDSTHAHTRTGLCLLRRTVTPMHNCDCQLRARIIVFWIVSSELAQTVDLCFQFGSFFE